MSPAPATGLALGSLGLGLARAWALTAGRAFLAPWLGRQAPAVSQQGRAWCSEATATRGTARPALVVATCWGPRLPWSVDPWESTPRALAREATTWGDRWTVWARRGVSRGGALPVAWTGRAATAQQAGRRAWWRRRRPVHRALPRTWTVRVLAERGVSARWWWRRSPRLGWPPWWRLHPGGPCRPPGQGRGGPLKTWVPPPGPPWPGTGRAGTGRPRQLPGTRRAGGAGGDQAPWWLLTALPPAARTACWDGVRAWSAQGLKSTQRAGWQGQRTRMTQPERAARLWRAVAVATGWLLSVGGEADATLPASPVLDVTARIPQPARPRRATRRRLVRVLRRGWPLMLVAWLHQAPLPLGHVVPAPWPAVLVPEEPSALQGLALPQAA